MARKRKAISTRTRFEVFKRDKFTCQYCGRTPPTVILHADHIVAVANGGDSSFENLITSCSDCNLGKSDKPLAELVTPRREALEEAKERAEQTGAYNQFLLEQREAQTEMIDGIGRYWFNSFCQASKDKFVFGPPRQATIRTFLKSITEAEILDAIDIAHSKYAVFGDDGNDNRTFRYFCGICWRKIKGE